MRFGLEVDDDDAITFVINMSKRRDIVEIDTREREYDGKLKRVSGDPSNLPHKIANGIANRRDHIF